MIPNVKFHTADCYDDCITILQPSVILVNSCTNYLGSTMKRVRVHVIKTISHPDTKPIRLLLYDRWSIRNNKSFLISFYVASLTDNVEPFFVILQNWN